MALRLKQGISPEILRQYGFVLGKEHFGKERWCGDGHGYEYQAEWYHKFLTIDNETYDIGEDLDEILYTDDEFDIPMCQMTFRIGNGDDLYIDCAPSGTYHVGGYELDIVADTIYKLVTDGVVELI